MDRICVGRIGAPHGVRGAVRLWVFTEDPLAITRYGALETEDRSQQLQIEALRPAKNYFVARMRGISDRSTAERLNNVRLFVPRERLPPTGNAETFYHSDLIGLTAVDRGGTVIGTVQAVHNFGAGDLLELAPHGCATVMLPFTTATVPLIDIAGGRIIVDPPVGLFED